MINLAISNNIDNSINNRFPGDFVFFLRLDITSRNLYVFEKIAYYIYEPSSCYFHFRSIDLLIRLVFTIIHRISFFYNS